MHDPMALATDYLLGAAALVFAYRLRRVHRMWAWAFAFTGLGAFLGGTYHAFAEDSALLWKGVVYSVGIASFFLLAGCAGHGGAHHRDTEDTEILCALCASVVIPPGVLRAFAVVKLIAFLAGMATHDEFVWVIADYGLTLLLVGVLHIVRRSAATPWVLGSIGVSIVGALVQQFRLSVHPFWFDFNDIYHVIQAVALYLLYRAGLARR